MVIAWLYFWICPVDWNLIRKKKRIVRIRDSESIASSELIKPVSKAYRRTEWWHRIVLMARLSQWPIWVPDIAPTMVEQSHNEMQCTGQTAGPFEWSKDLVCWSVPKSAQCAPRLTSTYTAVLIKTHSMVAHSAHAQHSLSFLFSLFDRLHFDTSLSVGQILRFAVRVWFHFTR